MFTFIAVPKAGLVIRDPVDGQPLPPEGRLVARSEFWDRRLAEGDVTLKEPPREPAPRAEKKD